MKFFQTIIILFFAKFIKNETLGEPETLIEQVLVSVNKERAVSSNICNCKDFKINCDLKTACVSDCRNEIRYANEVDCVFPFQYKGVWYDTCTDVDRPGKYWCSLERVYSNKFAECEEKCPYLARQLVINDVGENHTSCRTPANEWVGVYPTDQEIQKILDLHNNERSIVNPSSSDMRLLFWDFGLARLAMNLAVTSDFNHDCANCRRLLNNKTIYNGQNLYYSSGLAYEPSSTWTKVVNAWISEKINWKYGNGSINGKKFLVIIIYKILNFLITKGDAVGHYTQVVNANTVRIGCAAGVKSIKLKLRINRFFELFFIIFT